MKIYLKKILLVFPRTNDFTNLLYSNLELLNKPIDSHLSNFEFAIYSFNPIFFPFLSCISKYSSKSKNPNYPHDSLNLEYIF